MDWLQVATDDGLLTRCLRQSRMCGFHLGDCSVPRATGKPLSGTLAAPYRNRPGRDTDNTSTFDAIDLGHVSGL
jgi:hypothetical protein